MTIAIEPIGPTNAQVYKDIRLRALLDAPTAFSSSYAAESKLTDADWVKRAGQWNSGANSVAYLAMDAEAAVGLAAGVRDRHDPERADLMSMWVAPTHRRLGIGRRLVDAISAWAMTQNVLHLGLMVTSNNDHATQFYQSLGLAFTGRRDPYPNDAALFNVEMSRSLR